MTNQCNIVLSAVGRSRVVTVVPRYSKQLVIQKLAYGLWLAGSVHTNLGMAPKAIFLRKSSIVK